MWPPWRDAKDRWRGTSVERAFLNLHAAKVQLVDVLSPAEIDLLVPDVLARMSAALDGRDPRRIAAETLARCPEMPDRRAALKQAMETAYSASDEKYSRLRDFRNILVLAALAFAFVTVILLLTIYYRPTSVPLCFAPSVTVASDTAPAGPMVCPSGTARPTGGDALIIAGLGALGGALAGLFAIRRLRGTSTPYGVSTALALVKVPSGALTALIGILFLAGGFVPGLSNLDTQRQILAYAVVFGYAQQLITRLADDRAQTILDNIPSKDADADQMSAGRATPELPPCPPPKSGSRTAPTSGEPTRRGWRRGHRREDNAP